jgi:hypothetical protein
MTISSETWFIGKDGCVMHESFHIIHKSQYCCAAGRVMSGDKTVQEMKRVNGSLARMDHIPGLKLE